MSVQNPQSNSPELAVSTTNDRLLAQLAPIPAGTPLRTGNVQQNKAVVAGNYPTGSATAPLDLYSVGGQVGPFTASSTCVLRNLAFTSTVTLTPAAIVLFNGCTFAVSVTMQAGSKASFNGCRFAPGANVINAGIAADAGILGCYSPTAHVNVTTVFSL